MDGAFYSRVPPLSPLSLPPLSQGPNTGRPVVSWNVGRGKSLSPLSRCARYLPLIRGVVPSPTVFKDTFRVRVGEALGPPADPWKPGGPVCRPYMYPEAIPFYRRGRTLAGPMKGFCHSGAHPHPPPSGAPVPIPSVAARHLPLIRGVGPLVGGRLAGGPVCRPYGGAGSRHPIS